MSEAEEQLENLNNFLVELEKDPSNRDLINEIFRIAHTLKGNAASLEYNKLSELAHKTENLLGLIRDGKAEATPEIVDLLFECLDELERGLEEIKEHGQEPEDMDFSDIYSKLEEMIQKIDSSPGVQEAPQQETSQEKESLQEEISIDMNQIDLEAVNAAREEIENGKVYCLRVVFQDSCEMPQARAALLIEELKKRGRIIKTSPEVKELTGKTMVVLLVTGVVLENELEDIKRVVGEIQELKASLFNEAGAIEPAEKSMETEESPQEKKRDIKNPVKEVTSIKVDVKSLDKLMNLIGELVINQIRLKELIKKYADEDLKEVTETFARLILDIQDEVMEARMIPVEQVFNRFPRMVRDLARSSGKKIDFQIHGGENKLDRLVLEKIGDPLVHLLRNAVDHGIEPPEERIAAGKPEVGRVTLSAIRLRNKVVLEIEDDGRGMDPEEIKRAAIERGVISKEKAQELDREQLIELIFEPGMSTKKEVTKISGRGVGMDVVKKEIKELGGHVYVYTQKGKGTKVTLELPLTVAVIRTLMVKLGTETYALPLSNIKSIEVVKTPELKSIRGSLVALLRGRDVPLIDLAESLGCPRTPEQLEKLKKQLLLVVVEKKNEMVGFVVDEILGEQQVILKTVRYLKKVQGVSGATILGSGEVSLILDLDAFT